MIKKTYFICIGLLSFATAYSQYPKPPQTIGVDSNVVQAKGGLQGRIINWNYADTTAANLERIRQYPGAQIFTTSNNKFWVRNSTNTAWVEVGKNLGNSNLSQTESLRTFDLNNGTLQFTDLGSVVIGDAPAILSSTAKLQVRNHPRLPIVAFGNLPVDAIPIWMGHTDTITSSNINLQTNRLAQIHRQLYVQDNGLSLLDRATSLTYLGVNAKDSVRLNTNGGDLFYVAKTSLGLTKFPGFSGRTVIQGGAVAFDAVPSFLAGTSTGGTSSPNNIRARGWWSGVTSYLNIPNTADTVDNYIGFLPGGIRNGKILKWYSFYSGSMTADSAWAIYSESTSYRSYHAGPFAIGGGNTGPTEALEVTGNTKLYSLQSSNNANDSMVVWNPTTQLLGKRAISAGGSQSWDQTMAISPDINGSYISIFNDNTWNLQSIADFTIHSDLGSTTRLKLSETESNLFAPNGSDGLTISNDEILLSNVNGAEEFKMTIDNSKFQFEWSDADENNSVEVNSQGVYLKLLSPSIDSIFFLHENTSASLTGYNLIARNPVTGSIVDFTGTISAIVAWNDITNPTGDQALTFDAGESSTWTNSNTTEDLFTVNSSTATTSSFFSLNRTSTALAAGNNIMELVSSGANGASSITATGLNVSVTNTGTTSTNIGLNLSTSGATYNYDIFSNGVVSFGAASIAAGATAWDGSATRGGFRLLDNAWGGLTFYNNANYSTALTIAAQGIATNQDLLFNALGGDMRFNMARVRIGSSVDATAHLHIIAPTTTANTGQIKLDEGSRQTTPEDGTINYVSNNIEFVETSTVYILAKTLTNTATLDFDLTAVNYQDLTVTVTGAAVNDAVSISVDPGALVADVTYFATVTATNTVTIRCSRVGGGGAANPGSGTFRASVIHY